MRVVDIDPREASRVEIERVQCRLLPVELVQVRHPALHAGVRCVLEQMPVQARLVVPLAPLGDLRAHEQQLLAGLSIHVAIEQPQVGELLPVVARHLREHRTFAMHNFVVGVDEDEVLVEGVEQAEAEIVEMVAAVHGVARHELEGVVHPAHVPLVAEAEPSDVNWP